MQECESFLCRPASSLHTAAATGSNFWNSQPADHHHARVRTKAVACGLHRTDDIQRHVLVVDGTDAGNVAGSGSCWSLDDDICFVGFEVVDSARGGGHRAAVRNLVEMEMVLYPVSTPWLIVVRVQYGPFGIHERHHMATTAIQSDLTTTHYRPTWRRRKLNTLIFFVTSHCNATCDTCFYWDELNKAGDLNWDEIVKLSKSTPADYGSVVQRRRTHFAPGLEEIINLFVKNNGVRHINLPTNGLKPARIFQIAERCLEANPKLELNINIALDGLRDSHDEMRGVPGNFDKAILTARTLRTLSPIWKAA
jgi:Predicted Fe-S oxidoreductases